MKTNYDYDALIEIISQYKEYNKQSRKQYLRTIFALHPLKSKKRVQKILRPIPIHRIPANNQNPNYFRRAPKTQIRRPKRPILQHNTDPRDFYPQKAILKNDRRGLK
jgi:hypothetical protein